MTEEWRPVPGYEGLYEVSDLGRVRSVDRPAHIRGGGLRLIPGRVLRPAPHKGGYRVHHLYSAAGARKVFSAHALVASAFLGAAPPGLQVCHEDGDPANCRLDNLRYDTPTGNNADKERHGNKLHGEAHPTAKLTADQVKQIRALRGVEPQKVTAKRFGITFSNVSAIQLGKSWRYA